MEKGTDLVVVADPDKDVQAGFERLFGSHMRVACFSETEAALQFLKQNHGTCCSAKAGSAGPWRHGLSASSGDHCASSRAGHADQGKLG